VPFPNHLISCNSTKSIHTFSTSCFKILLAPGLYNDSTCQVPMLKQCQGRLRLVFSFIPRLILYVIVTRVFHRGRSLARRPTPNVENKIVLLDRRYNSVSVLVRSTIVFHESLFNTFFQFLIFIVCRSFLTSSSHLFFGLRVGLEESGDKSCLDVVEIAHVS
jgi:hypothetical protein